MESSSNEVCSAQHRLCLKFDGTLPYSVSYPVNITELQVSDLNHGYIGYYGICVEEITANANELEVRDLNHGYIGYYDITEVITALMEKLSLGS